MTPLGILSFTVLVLIIFCFHLYQDNRRLNRKLNILLQANKPHVKKFSDEELKEYAVIQKHIIEEET